MSTYEQPPSLLWAEFFQAVNESLLTDAEWGIEQQAALIAEWFDTVDDSWITATDVTTDGMDGHQRAYEVWMNAAEQQLERARDAVDGESVPPEDFRDIWLTTANRTFKELMSTTAFAAATGESIEESIEQQRQADETAEETLHTFGFSTKSDIEAIGARIVELERRQHEVEQKLDRVIAALEEPTQTPPDADS